MNYIILAGVAIALYLLARLRRSVGAVDGKLDAMAARLGRIETKMDETMALAVMAERARTKSGTPRANGEAHT